jgi:hypothetical protein
VAKVVLFNWKIPRSLEMHRMKLGGFGSYRTQHDKLMLFLGVALLGGATLMLVVSDPLESAPLIIGGLRAD